MLASAMHMCAKHTLCGGVVVPPQAEAELVAGCTEGVAAVNAAQATGLWIDVCMQHSME